MDDTQTEEPSSKSANQKEVALQLWCSFASRTLTRDPQPLSAGLVWKTVSVRSLSQPPPPPPNYSWTEFTVINGAVFRFNFLLSNSAFAYMHTFV